MPALPRKTIHFGFAHIFSLSTFTKTDFRTFESLLESRQIFTGSNSWNGTEGILHCHTNTAPTESGINAFLVKLTKLGELNNATRDSIFGLSVIFENAGDHNDLSRISQIAISILINDFRVSPSVISKEATIRILIGPIPNTHAFKFIWEGIIQKQESDLANFGTPVVGGGLRIVGTSRFSGENGFFEQAERDFKFESYLLDPAYIYVENTYRWQVVAPYIDENGLTNSIAPIIRQIETETHTSANAIAGPSQDAE